MIMSIQAISEGSGAATISPLHMWGSLSQVAQARVSSLVDPSWITTLGTSSIAAPVTFDAVNLAQIFSSSTSSSGLNAAQQHELATAAGLTANSTSSDLINAINTLLMPADASQVMVDVLVSDANTAAAGANPTNQVLFNNQGVIVGVPGDSVSQARDAMMAALLDIGASGVASGTTNPVGNGGMTENLFAAGAGVASNNVPAASLNLAMAENAARANSPGAAVAAGGGAEAVPATANIPATNPSLATAGNAAVMVNPGGAILPVANTEVVAATVVGEAAAIKAASIAAPAATATPATIATNTVTVATTTAATIAPAITVTPATAATNTVTPAAATFAPAVTIAPAITVTPATAATNTVIPATTFAPAVTIAPATTVTPATTAANNVTAAAIALGTTVAAGVAGTTQVPQSLPAANEAQPSGNLLMAETNVTTAQPETVATPSSTAAVVATPPTIAPAVASTALTTTATTANTIPVIRFDNASSVLQSLIAEAAAHAIMIQNPASATYSVGGAMFQMGMGADHVQQFTMKGNLPDIRAMTRHVSPISLIRGSKERKT